MDWWPNNKCDGTDGISDCAWENSSLLNAPIESPLLQKALEALSPITLRLGGTLSDNITYAIGSDENITCPDFSPEPPATDRIFHGGCLTSTRWKELQKFCQRERECYMLFGLNGMYGRECEKVEPTHAECFYSDAVCTSSWDSSNVREFVRSTAGR